ncbi:MAG: ATP-binding protein [Elainellaceae cyanobacterium]
MIRILLIDDSLDDRLLAIHALEQEFSDLRFQEVNQAQDFEQALAIGQFDLVITDYELRWNDGITILRSIKAQYPDCPVIMFTSSGSQEIAVEAMKSGLEDYVIKSPKHLMRLPAAVRRALEQAEVRNKATGLELRFQSLLNDLDVGVYRLTAEGSLLEGNPAFLRLLGLDHLTEIPADQSLEPYFNAADYAELLDQLRQNGAVEMREIQLRQVDGSIRWVRLSKRFKTIGGQTVIDGLMADITNQKKVEGALRNSEQRLSFLVNASRILASSLDYRTTVMNTVQLAIPTLADWCFVDVVKSDFSTFMEPVFAASSPERQALFAELRQRYPLPSNARHGSHRVLQTGVPECVAEVTEPLLQAATPDPEHLNLLRQFKMTSYAVVPLKVQEQVIGVMGFVSARSDLRYRASDLAMIEELAQRAAIAITNARLYQNAQDANRLKDEFLAMVSHEVRSPLNSILGWAQLLRTQQLDQAVTSKALETIERNAKHQSKLIDDILDISRVIRNQIRLDLKPTHLVSVIETVIQDVQPLAQAKSMQIDAVLDPAVAEVMGDTGRLQQVVWNLLSNAIKFTPAGGRVQVTLEQVGALAQIQVIDTGQGIRAEFLPHVFDRFRQADGSITRAHGGLGLGLAITQQLVEMHQGKIMATSEGEGKGSTFTVQIPIAGWRSQATIPERSPAVNSGLALHGVRVLVVDDDSDTRELVAFTLEQEGAEVLIAASASEALQQLAQSIPNVLISDIGMPNEDGLTLIRKIRSLDRLPDAVRQIPAIALTAFARKQDQEQALVAGFQYHFAKPINPDELVKTVASITKPV